MSTLASVAASAAGSAVSALQTPVVAPPRPPAESATSDHSASGVTAVSTTPPPRSQGAGDDQHDNPSTGYGPDGEPTSGSGYQRSLVDIKI